MIRNGFSLPVGVRRKINIVGFFRRGFESRQNLALASDGDIIRFEIIFDIHPQLALGQISDVSQRSLKVVASPQNLGQCSGFSR